ncbi:unnamed protein product [Allacma fusca]|uniref:RING-type domain-containing protein n=1 Tax=Allacma fusca TaxID=39272 RepID=A0A8J2PD51_9HEXA|nr:unnamed protein product [Allacma fusca]
MTVYICCICMKPLDETLKLEELVLPQNEEDDIEIYADDSPSEEFGFDEDSAAFIVSNDVVTSALRDQVDEGDRFVDSVPPKWLSLPPELNNVSSSSQNWSAVVSTPCGHLYHLGCIHSWMDHLEKRGWEPTCAYCRHIIYNSMELIPIFPVSIKEEDSDGEFCLKNSPNPHSCKIRDMCANEIKVQESTLEKVIKAPEGEIGNNVDDAVSYEVNVWVATCLVVLALCFYLGYVSNYMENLDSEDSEDVEVDPLFGNTWTALITITFALALLTDFCYSNCLNANNSV